MILSRKFVKDYIDLDDNLTIKEIAESMTLVGNEYDKIGKLIEGTNLVTGSILECEMHPDSDHLHICKVSIGSEVLQIVCGAPNCRRGLKVIVAQVGAILPGGEIKKGVIRGIESNGMLCSLKELGLDSKYLSKKDIEGISELPEDTPLGVDPRLPLLMDDEYIDFELTSNRGDELSILGLAYELGAIYKLPVKDIDLKFRESTSSIKDKFNVSVKTKNCSLFLARRVNNVVIGESPLFIKNRLMACGIRPINNVVDISNYVMLETGQPLHFYDADCLGEEIIIRDAYDNEKLMTLDGANRELTNRDIVIANKEEAVGLAGVMGGFKTEVTNDTHNIIIESAIFDATVIRKTSKHVLRSEASNRFEKGLDPKRTYMAMDRAVTLLSKYASGEILKDMIVYDKTNKNDKVISITSFNINDVLGTNISSDEIVSVFRSLGFGVIVEGDTFSVTVPTRRMDISIKEDLIEEVGRIYGINNIVGKLPDLGIRRGSYDRKTRDIRNKMVDLGLNEVLTYVFSDPSEVKLYTNDTFEPVKLLDPLSIDRSYIRYSLIPSLMKVYNYNKSRNINDISIFEMGKGYYLKDNNYGEDYKLCALLSGKYFQETGHDQKVDFYILKGIVEEILDYLGYKNRYSFIVDNNIPSELHPGVSASINVNGIAVGILGKVHPQFIKDDVYVMEINLDTLSKIKTGKIKYHEISKYPNISKDVAFIVSKDITCESLIKEIKKIGGKNLVNILLFDIYEGENIGSSKRSLAFNLVFNDSQKTLTIEEVMPLFNKIIDGITSKFNCELRDK